jgi:hypothetical protein
MAVAQLAEIVEELPAPIAYVRPRGRPKTIFTEEQRKYAARIANMKYRETHLEACVARNKDWESRNRDARCARKKELYRLRHPLPPPLQSESGINMESMISAEYVI